MVDTDAYHDDSSTDRILTSKPRTPENGENGRLSHCQWCDTHFGGSLGVLVPGKYIDGKIVCMGCYPQAVDVFLADRRLNSMTLKQGIAAGRCALYQIREGSLWLEYIPTGEGMAVGDDFFDLVENYFKENSWDGI